MIEELKVLLNMVGDLSGIAAYLIVGFLLFKLIIYLSTTGSIVYLVKLLIVKVHSVLTTPRVKTVEISYQSLRLINSTVVSVLRDVLETVRNERTDYISDYIHTCDVHFIRDAVNEKMLKDKEAMRAEE